MQDIVCKQCGSIHCVKSGFIRAFIAYNIAPKKTALNLEIIDFDALDKVA
jgi:hypothetical protein